MTPAARLYALLETYGSRPFPVREVLIGAVWTLCRTDAGIGLAMSPATPSRTLPWSGTLVGRPLAELTGWINAWEPYQASVGMAAINAGLADLLPAIEGTRISAGSFLPANLSVFEHFLPALADQAVVVVGRYPGLEALGAHCRLQVIERIPGAGDFPDPASEYLLPEADWVFLTASSLTNKTFPRLAELSRDARTVLMGPTTPWLPELAEWGVDYLAGVDIIDPDKLGRTIAEGGGIRIFEENVAYRLIELDEIGRLAWIKRRIAVVFAEKERLTTAMEDWHRSHSTRFPEHRLLETTQQRLSQLDTAYQGLWRPELEPLVNRRLIAAVQT